jgi:G:T/U-mismatch repair DNA glycosylase
MLERHPYGEFMPKLPRSMIIGSFPIGKFTNPLRRQEIKPHELDFFFGGEKNLLWRLLGDCFKTSLKNKSQIIELLEREGIALGDVISACRRRQGRASDADLYDIHWNQDLLARINQHGIKKVYFTSRQVEKWFIKLFPQHELQCQLLLSPSAQSARSIGGMPDYKSWRLSHPQQPLYAFILQQYLLILS